MVTEIHTDSASYVRTRKLEKHFRDLYNVQDLCERFGVTSMTIYLWRKRNGLPTVNIDGAGRNAIRFVPADVRRWAITHEIPFRGGDDVRRVA